MEKIRETRINFTLRALENVTYPADYSGKQFRLSDTKVRGLSLRISKGNQKTYIYYRRLPKNNENAGRIVEITLGNLGEVSLERVRAKAEELNGLIGQGLDPIAPPQVATRELTYHALFLDYLEQHAKIRTKTWKESEDIHRRYFPEWKDKLVSKIDTEEVQRWVNKLAGEKKQKKATANKAFDQMNAVINYGIRKKKLKFSNPCYGVDKFPAKSRKRFIQPGDEYQRFKASLAQEPNTGLRDFFWLKYLVGARRGNVLQMSWDQISFELELWIVPETETKNGEIFPVPLTPEALEVLHRRYNDPARHEKWVFPSNRRSRKTGDFTHFVNPAKAWKRLLNRADITDLRVHDLRHTGGSYMAITGASSTIIGRALGHKSLAATAMYTHLTHAPVREAMTKAQQMLENSIAQQTNVPKSESDKQDVA